MKRTLKDFIKRTPIHSALRTLRQWQQIKDWERRGKPAPPPHIVKQLAIREFAARFRVNVLIETGTYYGDMVEAMKGYFSRIYSIELSDELYKKARRRFAGNDKIQIIQGDSGIVLGSLVASIDQAALFWLDGHYSAGVTARGNGDTPIYEELTHIFNGQERGHVVIIDDARCFGTNPNHPSIDELSKFIRANNPNVTIEVKNDSIRVFPYNQID